jgi:hypothetical protein
MSEAQQIPPVVEEAAKEAAQNAVVKWVTKMFRWLRNRL